MRIIREKMLEKESSKRVVMIKRRSIPIGQVIMNASCLLYLRTSIVEECRFKDYLFIVLGVKQIKVGILEIGRINGVQIRFRMITTGKRAHYRRSSLSWYIVTFG